MSQQNFVEQFRLFMEYARKKSMHARECMLWVSLFYLANEEATYNAVTQTYDWPDDFFEVSNGELNSYGRFDKQAIEQLRNRLKQRGLIDFIKGERNSANPMYKIHYLVKVGNKIIPNIEANNLPNPYANPYANQLPNNLPNPYANQSANPTPHPININNIYNTALDSEENDDPDDDVDEDEDGTRARAGVREEFTAAWMETYGKAPNPGLTREMGNRLAGLDFERGIITQALRIAVLRNADSPCQYMLTLLANWSSNNVKTLTDLDQYLLLWDMQTGKLGDRYANEAGDKLRAFREDRESPEEREWRLQREARWNAELEERRAMIQANQAEREAVEYARKEG